jgi:competence protein ComEA
VIERLHLSKGIVVLLGAVIAAAAVISVFAILMSRSTPDLVIVNDPTQPEIAVEIRGEVRQPGVYRFDYDARVADLIEAAGGTTGHADLSQVNLALRIGDGSQITIPGIIASPIAMIGTPSVPTQATIGIGSGPVNINTASAEQLEGLPGIGPVLATRIVEWRSTHGPFASLDALEQIEGISGSTVDELMPYATVGP